MDQSNFFAIELLIDARTESSLDVVNLWSTLTKLPDRIPWVDRELAKIIASCSQVSFSNKSMTSARRILNLGKLPPKLSALAACHS